MQEGSRSLEHRGAARSAVTGLLPRAQRLAGRARLLALEERVVFGQAEGGQELRERHVGARAAAAAAGGGARRGDGDEAARAAGGDGDLSRRREEEGRGP